MIALGRHRPLTQDAWSELAVRAVVEEIAALWTGDVGLAIYLWDCITGEPRFPTIDVF